jgi:hypothetical protein
MWLKAERGASGDPIAGIIAEGGPDSVRGGSRR